MYWGMLTAPRNEADDIGLIKTVPGISCSMGIDLGKIVNSSFGE